MATGKQTYEELSLQIAALEYALTKAKNPWPIKVKIQQLKNRQNEMLKKLDQFEFLAR